MKIDENIVIKCNNLKEVRDCFDKLEELGFKTNKINNYESYLIVSSSVPCRDAFGNYETPVIDIDKNITNYKHFLKLYNKMKEPDNIIDFMKREPINIVIENKADYKNIIDYLDKKNIKWNSKADLKSLKQHNTVKTLSFYDGNKCLRKGLFYSSTEDDDIKSITTKELFEKFNIEYYEPLPDFEYDNNGRITKINDWESEDELYTLKESFRICDKFEDNIEPYILLGIIFYSKESLDNYKKYLTIHTKLKNLADKLNNGVEIDWENKKQMKFQIYYECETLGYNFNYYRKNQGIHCLDESFLDTAKKEIGVENLTWYFKQSY